MKIIRFDPQINRQLHSEEINKLNTLIPYCGEGIIEWKIENDTSVSILCKLSENANVGEVESLLELAFRHSQNTPKIDEKVAFSFIDGPPNVFFEEALKTGGHISIQSLVELIEKFRS